MVFSNPNVSMKINDEYVDITAVADDYNGPAGAAFMDEQQKRAYQSGVINTLMNISKDFNMRDFNYRRKQREGFAEDRAKYRRPLKKVIVVNE